jgi:HK97 family phage major capsid protein
MNKLLKLRQQKAAEKAKMLALDALATRENRDLTADEKTQMQASIALCASLDTDILIAEALVEAEREASATTAVVGHNNAEDKPWASLAEQMTAIQAAVNAPHRADARLFAAQGASEAVDADGGFLIAPQFSETIVRRTFANGVLASKCKVMPMSSNRLVMNGANDASRADGQRNGGITSFWTYEAGLYTKSKPTFRQIALQIDKLTVLTFATTEQLEDGPAWEAYVNDVVPDEFAFKVDDAILNGPGTGGGPLGIYNSSAILAVARQTAGTVTPADVFQMYSQMPYYLRKDAAWYVNQDLEPTLWNMTRGAGTAVELLYKAPGSTSNPSSDYGTLLGLPIIPIEQAATTGTQGDITLGAFSQYMLGRRGGVNSDTSIHVAFQTGEKAYRWQLRVAGETLWDKPVTPKNSTKLQSPFIQLHA